MILKVIDEAGCSAALFGLGLSHGLTSELSVEVAQIDYLVPANNAVYERLAFLAHKLCDQDGGHNKFLESIAVWLDIDAPRFWWSEMDTYRVGISKQSESTMHTLGKRQLTQEDFEDPIYNGTMDWVNMLIRTNAKTETIKNDLPEGFLQRRIVCTNYKVLRNIILQRRTHKLPQWQLFCREVVGQVQHPELLPEVK